MTEPDDPAAAAVRRLAAHLDRASRPVDLATVKARARGGARGSRPMWVAVSAALVVAAVGGALLLLTAGGDDREPVVAGPTTTIEPVDTTSDLPDSGLARLVVNGTDLELLDDAGDVVGRVPVVDEVLYASPPALEVVDDGGELRARSATGDGADVPDGCSAAVVAGTVRAALCGDDPDLPDRIDLVDHLGAHREVALAPPGHLAGHWRSLVAAPDGAHVLAQWSGECEIPSAWIVTVADGGLQPVFGDSETIGLGWDDDGRALVQALTPACGSQAAEPGVYALEPEAGGQGELLLPVEGFDRIYRWTNAPAEIQPTEVRILASAAAALGRTVEPAPGTVEGTVLIDEVQVTVTPINAALPYVPFNDLVSNATATTVAGGPATTGDQDTGSFYAVTCGDRVWTTTHPAADRAATLLGQLVPRLGCTLGPAPVASGHENLGPEVQAAADDLAARFLALARDPGEDTVADLPFDDTVLLGLDGDELVAVDRAALADPASWTLAFDERSQFVGSTSALELLAGTTAPLDAELRPSSCYSGAPLEIPDALSGYEDVAFQPTDARACFESFRVTVYTHPTSGRIAGVVITVFDP